jgi:hypothetical protein
MKSIISVSFCISILLLTTSFSVQAFENEKLCLGNVCIGDNVDALDIKWKKVKIDFKTNRAVKAHLASKKVDELYYEYNEQLITDKTTLEQLVPHIIQLQKFDGDVLDKLLSVKAICSPLSLTGEVDDDSTSKMFVTFRTVADEGKRGKLRVVQLEKEFNIFPPHIRPTDKDKYVSMVQTLKQDYPGLLMVRDIDARAMSNEVAFANTLLGYRFNSDVNVRLTFRIRDLTDIEPIDVNPQRSAHCPELEY